MKQNSGITLIALISTVLVLLILVGLSIGAIANSSRILDKSNQMAEKTNNKIDLTQETTDTLVSEWNKIDNIVNEWNNKDCIKHIYSWNVTKSATCAEQGIKTGTCVNCGIQTTDTIPIIDIHKFENGTCRVCGKKICNTKLCPGDSEITCTTCNGNGAISNNCPGGTPGTKCSQCNGKGKIQCTGTLSYNSDTSSICKECSNNRAIWKCNKCSVHCTDWYCRDHCNSIKNIYYEGAQCTMDFTCSSCTDGYIGRTYCEHNKTEEHTILETCTTCNGSQKIIYDCPHDSTQPHRYCEHYTNTTLKFHMY